MPFASICQVYPGSGTAITFWKQVRNPADKSQYIGPPQSSLTVAVANGRRGKWQCEESYWFHPKYLMPQAKISDGMQRDFRVSPHSPSRIGSGSSPYAVQWFRDQQWFNAWQFLWIKYSAIHSMMYRVHWAMPRAKIEANEIWLSEFSCCPMCENAATQSKCVYE